MSDTVSIMLTCTCICMYAHKYKHVHMDGVACRVSCVMSQVLKELHVRYLVVFVSKDQPFGGSSVQVDLHVD